MMYVIDDVIYKEAKDYVEKIRGSNDVPAFERCVMDEYWSRIRGKNQQPCANEAMDKWEKANLRLEDQGKPRMLYCPCPRCNKASM